jgi:hypothetical protein
MTAFTGNKQAYKTGQGTGRVVVIKWFNGFQGVRIPYGMPFL